MNISRINTFFAAVACTFLIVSCTGDPLTPTPEIWSGAPIQFEKADNADPDDAANQDRITDQVWITRGIAGGQIYNAVLESGANKDSSPEGTQWAIGTTEGLDTLTFGPFRQTVGNPQDVVGQKLVLLLEQENIAIDISFISWSSGQKGGFAYERATN